MSGEFKNRRHYDRRRPSEVPYVCPKCNGFTTLRLDQLGHETPFPVPCPVCNHTGLIWPVGDSDLQEKIAAIKAARKPNWVEPEKRVKKGKGGRKPGFMFERIICTVILNDGDICGELVALNWAVRHMKDHAAKGELRDPV